MKVAKRFRWEAAHRIPWHEAGCQNNHGHSYEMWVELEGDQQSNPMLIDFKVIKRVLGPLVDRWDHATLIAEADTPYLEAARDLGWKHEVFPFDTTAENLARYVADYLCTEALDELHEHGIDEVCVRIHETETCYAEASRAVTQPEAEYEITDASRV